jgi:hypothetical protein
MMMNDNFIEIHEFSTGIKVGRNNDGNWISLGFTGRFINSTFQDSIPHPVERAIANGEFKIREGTASDNPAVVGRVVGINSDLWSVIAVVTKGRDEKGRSFPAIRYFLSEGEDKIPLILEWLEESGDPNTSPRIKVFNPDDLPIDNLPHQYNISSKQEDPPLSIEQLERLKNGENLPIITDPKIAKIKFIHQLTSAQIKAEEAKGIFLPLAWAFNVQVVEHINKFIVIHPANDSAAEILRKMRVSAALSLPAALFDEQALKAAITNITNNSNIKDEHFVAFAKELLNEQIDEKNWVKILDGQGAKNALSQGIYTPQMVKLIILRAIIIPSTLPQCFEWIQAKDKKSDVRTTAKEFERVISTKINALSPELKVKLLSCIDDGFSAFIAKVAESKISPDTAREFLLDKEGLWGKEAKNFLKKLHNDLEKMPIYAKKNDDLMFELKILAWSAFRNQIVQFWGKYPQFDEKIYLPLALTFRDIQPESLSIIFYHMSGKKIPHDLIKNSQEFYSSSSRFPLYGIRVERELNFVESLRETLNYCLEWIVYQPQNRNSMKRITAIISIIFAFLMGGAGGYVLHKFMPKGEEVNKTSFLTTGNDDSTLRSSINRNGNADILRDPNQANKEIVAKYIYKLYESESQKQLPDQAKRDEVRQKNLMLLQGEDKNKLEEILKALVREPNGSIKKEIKRHIAKLSSEEIDRLSNSIMLNGNQP